MCVRTMNASKESGWQKNVPSAYTLTIQCSNGVFVRTINASNCDTSELEGSLQKFVPSVFDIYTVTLQYNECINIWWMPPMTFVHVDCTLTSGLYYNIMDAKICSKCVALWPVIYRIQECINGMHEEHTKNASKPGWLALYKKFVPTAFVVCTPTFIAGYM